MNCKLRRLDLLRGAKMSDCEIHVTYMDKVKKICCRHKFRCHQIILASASEVFAEKFRDPNFVKNGRIVTVQGSPEAFEALLLYVYTYEICNIISMDICAELLQLANTYKIRDFIDAYVAKIAAQDWPIQMILHMFSLANEYNSATMMDVVAAKILPAAEQLFNDNSFLRLNIDELKALITILKTKEVLSEAQLLEALKKYQDNNDIKLQNMPVFQKFVEIANMLGEVHFLADGTLTTGNEAMPSRQSKENAPNGEAGERVA